MSNSEIFEQAIAVVLRHEGHIANDPDDPGGYTVYGISLRAAKQLGDLDGDGWAELDLDHDGDVDIDDMQSVTLSEAKAFYKKAYWRPVYETLPPVIAVKLFDFAVNMGHSQAHKLIQRAVRAANPSGERLIDDGIIGRRSLKGIKSCDPDVLLAALRSEAAGFYRSLAAANHRMNKFLNGWLNRAYS